MGIGGSTTPKRWTANLWKIIKSNRYNQYILQEAQQAITCDAYITTPNQGGAYMFPTVSQKRNLNAVARKQDQVEFCDHLMKMLSEQA